MQIAAPITLRLANHGDGAAMRRLAERDSASLPPGPHLVANREGELEAAISLQQGGDRGGSLPPHGRAGRAAALRGPPANHPTAARAAAASADGARGAARVSPSEPTIRRELRPGDLGAIVAHHGRIYLARVRARLDLRGARRRQRRRRRQAGLSRAPARVSGSSSATATTPAASRSPTRATGWRRCAGSCSTPSCAAAGLGRRLIERAGRGGARPPATRGSGWRPSAT